MVLAFAGRRIDAPDAAVKRFPADCALVVGQRIQQALVERGARVLVSSAACGADLLALEAAGNLGLRRRVVLPFARMEFRQRSVADRPGNWGVRFDRILDEVEVRKDLVLLGLSKDDRGAFAAANATIFVEANVLARENGGVAEACVVWDGESRGPGDVTAAFLLRAQEARLKVTEIRTLVA